MFLQLDDRTRSHLALALAEHLKWCRRQAIAAPPELAALLDTLTDSDRQQPPKVPAEPVIGDGWLISYETAARLLSVSRRTVERMVSDGKLQPVPVGRRRLILVDELRRLADAAA
ncbi:DNA-binding protein [Kribbella turkmenica]|uniref:DNA-binding protein n=1 Tax=Kribbella turkmenica TaxID=2530375 RepID=A0A4R4X7V7_9ACTN|nr:helix-turn-helix domain-containing protein [Kribbella turkmenica]TDD26541.1 DNA-binding protein [Kribbella turkmenica]